MSYLEMVKKQLLVDESLKTKLYRDTVGKLTIGVGRNIEDVGVSVDEALFMLDNDIAAAEKLAQRLLGTAFDDLNDVRKAVVINMSFNMGPKFGLFKNTLGFIASKQYDQAATEMGKSLWAKQVGERSDRLIKMMRTGVLPS